MSNYTDISREDLERKAQLQQRHYELFNELQQMSSQLPMEYQQRMPYELLSSLASCLLDNTVIQIVRGLKEIQSMLEKSLSDRRQRQLDQLKANRNDLKKRNLEDIALRKITQEQANQKEKQLEEQIKEETRRINKRVVDELDNNVREQQTTLANAGLPGFRVTNKPMDIRIQMYLIDFVLRISDQQSTTLSDY